MAVADSSLLCHVLLPAGKPRRDGTPSQWKPAYLDKPLEELNLFVLTRRIDDLDSALDAHRVLLGAQVTRTCWLPPQPGMRAAPVACRELALGGMLLLQILFLYITDATVHVLVVHHLFL